ncbi:OapC/ArvC family zinc-ribbon domain-containing protein [Natrinema amylolyticum]|uniref:OapC/ArvC family zinc-ribbon domain-containing protein n=1 Tax=Natrinema amylolyticum TaxID=2878679 RepID=UPI001CFBFFE9|nr:Zn-ribbon containing protein [Natrinema amylolyticum]
MPHQCTNCGRTFADGSKEMLSGCPDCGGNKFQFAPTTTAAAESSGGTETDGSRGADTASASADASSPESDSVATRAAETVRGWVSAGSANEPDAESAERPASNGSTAATGSDGSWPSSDDTGSSDSNPPSDGEFDEWPETARRPEDRSGSPAEAADGSSTETATDERTSSRDPSDRPSSSPSTTATMADDENSAQADARSEVVPSADLPSHSESPDGDGSRPDSDAGNVVGPQGEAETGAGSETDVGVGSDADDQPPEHGRVVSEPSGERPSIEDLRAELNEQFESIKIVRPGQYELNLMELYNRDEYIISLQEDGRYVIDVPDSWHDGDEDDD